MVCFRAMVRAVLAAILLFYLGGVTAAAEAEAAPPLPERGLVSELGPELPHPEEEARSDPRFAAAARYTAARQLSMMAAALLIVASLLALHYGVGAGLDRLGRGHDLLRFAITSAVVGVVVAVWLLAAAGVRVAFASRAGVAPATSTFAGPGALALLAAAFTFSVGAARARWPRTWWIAITSAAVVGAVAGILFLPLPPAREPTSPTAGLLLERVQYLSSQYRLPPYKIAIDDRPGATGRIVATAHPTRRTLVVTAGAQELGRYEAEVFLAAAILRAEARRTSVAGALALITFMASLIAAEPLARLVARRGGAEAKAPPPLLVYAAVLCAIWSAAGVAFAGWNRRLWLRADAEAITLTRKPIAAITLYYREAAANLRAAEPHPVLHFLADAAPSPAERAAQARRLRLELAGRK
ncbi:MAG: hypothetical protein JSU81_11350 [Candidatus Coatesbacteria bacterium]|nr:MAG: hypothetical protein JSU81_11350 [Candidatus Coatesbacteria bacterium]